MSSRYPRRKPIKSHFMGRAATHAPSNCPSLRPTVASRRRPPLASPSRPQPARHTARVADPAKRAICVSRDCAPRSCRPTLLRRSQLERLMMPSPRRCATAGPDPFQRPSVRDSLPPRAAPLWRWLHGGLAVPRFGNRRNESAGYSSGACEDRRLKQRGGRGPYDGGWPRWTAPRECACEGGNRASCGDVGCWAETCALS